MTLFIVSAIGVVGVVLTLWLRRFDTSKRLADNLVKLNEHDIDYPGHMAFANKGGEYFHGCRVARFRNVSELNHFFEPGAMGHLKLVGEILPMPDSSLLVVYTQKLSNKEIERTERWSRDRHEYFAEERRKEEAEELERAEEKAKEQAETLRLAEIGRKVEARKAKIRGLAPGSAERKDLEKKLAAGDVDE